MDANVGGHGHGTLPGEAREPGGVLEPLLKELGGAPDPSKDKNRCSKTLWRVRSSPAIDSSQATEDIGTNHGYHAPKRIPTPPRPPFAQDGGMSPLLKAVLALVVYLLVGMASFAFLEDDLSGRTTSTFVDALYFAIVTMTTVGYGDIVPRGVLAKLFTCAFVFTGFGLVGVLVSGAANYLVEKQENILVQKFYLKYKHKENPHPAVDEQGVVAAHWKAAVAGAAVLVLFIAGVLVLIYQEGMIFLDAFYCVCVTVTTLGYGDQSFNTEGGRMFAIVWILLSTVCVAQFFLYLAEVKTEERQHAVAVWALSRKTTPSDLEAADLDGDNIVTCAEFVIYKLKECGKINEEDVLEIMEEFNTLDVDQSGTLNNTDIHLSGLTVNHKDP